MFIKVVISYIIGITSWGELSCGGIIKMNTPLVDFFMCCEKTTAHTAFLFSGKTDFCANEVVLP